MINDSTYDWLSILGTGMLTVDANMSGTVNISVDVTDGKPPSLLRISGDRELIEAAGQSGRVLLELVGLKFRTCVTTQMKKPSRIFVEAKPLFQALARHLEARSYH
jgi:hypothetical protein